MFFVSGKKDVLASRTKASTRTKDSLASRKGDIAASGNKVIFST